MIRESFVLSGRAFVGLVPGVETPRLPVVAAPDILGFLTSWHESPGNPHGQRFDKVPTRPQRENVHPRRRLGFGTVVRLRQTGCWDQFHFHY